MVIECSREYIVTDTTFVKCDSCKKLFSKAFDLTPAKKIHGFDNLILCVNCIDKAGLIFNVDVKKLVEAGSVEECQKKI